MKDPQQPPSWARKFLAWYCRPELLEDLEGDLNEFFIRNRETHGLRYAKLIYVLDVMKFFRLYTIRPPALSGSGVQLDLLKIYSAAAFRGFLKTKLSAALSVISLTLGLSCFLIISLFVYNELNYNRHYKNHDRIGRVSLSLIDEQSRSETHLVWTNPQLPDELRASYPEIEAVTGVLKLAGKTVVKKDGTVFPEENFFTVDQHYIKVFDHEWLAGDKKTALAQPASVVLTESLAVKYFGDEQSLNQVLTINDRNYRVSGIIADTPPNTDLRINALVSLDSHFDDWCMTYILFKDKETMVTFPEKLDTHFDEYLRPILDQTGSDGSFHLEALSDIHFGTPKLFDTPKTNRLTLIVFASIALIILLVTVVNYLAIAVARSIKKRADMSIRRAFGALPGQIKLQHITEMFLLTSVSFLLAILLIFCIAPTLRENQILNLYPGQWIDFRFLGVGFLLVLFLSLFAGGLPVFATNKSNPAAKLVPRGSGRIFHTAFIATHLTVTLSLIFSTKVVRNQMDALLKIEPGYDTKQILVVDIPTDTTAFTLLDHLKTSLSGLSFVSDVSLAGPYSIPTNDLGFDIFTVDNGTRESWKAIDYIQVDENYFDLFNIRLREGTIFKQPDSYFDYTDNVVVNEALVEAMGWEHPLEEQISHYEVSGVVENFNFYGLEQKAEPMIFRFNNELPEKMLIRFREATKANLQTVENVWAGTITGHRFSYRFLDDYFEHHLKREHTLKNLLIIFTLLALLIAGIGLFASINIRMEQTMKETGIRRILGAGLLQLLSRDVKEYMIGIAIAAIVAFPVTVLMLSAWLEAFAYKTPMDAFTGLESILFIIMLGCMATTYHAIRLRGLKPLDSIKHE